MGSHDGDFTEFYRTARDGCLRAVLVTVGDRDLAQDLVDEAFARALASWRKVSRHPAPSAWVIRTALNDGVSRWRRRRREVAVSDLAQLSDPPVLAAEDAGIDITIMNALRRLPTRQRQVIALRVFLDLDTENTANALGVAPSTVKAHLARALEALREDLVPIRERETQS